MQTDGRQVRLPAEHVFAGERRGESGDAGGVCGRGHRAHEQKWVGCDATVVEYEVSLAFITTLHTSFLRMAKAKQSARMQTTFNILNIKLRQPDAKESTPAQYADLIVRLNTIRPKIKLSTTLGAVPRRFIRDRVGNTEVIVGFITKYTIIENGKWIDLNDPEGEGKDVPIPGNTAANSRDTLFYFVPANHRMALVQRKGSLSPQNAKLFLEGAFKNILSKGQYVDIDIAPSTRQYQKIVDSKLISRIEINLTYSNNDLNDEFTELLDEELKKSNTNQLKLIATAEKGERLDLQQSSFLQGALGLARDNGEVTATETGPTGRRTTIRPSTAPQRETIVSEQPSDLLRDVSATLLNLYPRPSPDGQSGN